MLVDPATHTTKGLLKAQPSSHPQPVDFRSAKGASTAYLHQTYTDLPLG
jgi:hypothetical protein